MGLKAEVGLVVGSGMGLIEISHVCRFGGIGVIGNWRGWESSNGEDVG